LSSTSDAKLPGQFFSAILLVAGACIGAGMLVLPTATGVLGFVPSVALLFVCWIFMTLTGLLILEVSLWMDEGAHFISMSGRFLGNAGKAISWLIYLFICYGSIIAYTAGGGEMIASCAEALTGFALSETSGAISFILVFGLVIHLGSRIVGRVNAILFIAMIVAFLALISTGMTHIKPQLLIAQKNISYSIYAIPLMLTSFSFQTLVPSLTPMLKRNVKGLRYSIIFGTLIVLVVYVIWEALTLGIIPLEGEQGLRSAVTSGDAITSFFAAAVQSPRISQVALFFSFFALVTSFLGMALGLFDFLSDGLKIKKQGLGRLYLSLLIAVPTCFFATNYERVFTAALEATGGFGDSILSGMLPVAMVWIGRYRHGLHGSYRVIGGKPLLVIVFLFYCGVFIFEGLLQTGTIALLYEGSRTLDF
jgi:tyrosine-specific transport protein